MNSPWILTTTLLTTIPLYAKAHQLGLEKGSPCNGGICSLLSECTTIIDIRKIRPTICSFEGKVPIICCPSIAPPFSHLVTTTKIPYVPSRPAANNIEPAVTYQWTISEKTNVGAKATRKCSEYSEKVCRGHHSTVSFHQVVVGGFESKPRDLNFMALLGYANGYEIAWRCGGSLISNYWVLSAAHCEKTILKQAKWIRLGELDLESVTDDAKPTDYTIQLSVIHPHYKDPQFYNDIALHKSQDKINFNDYVLPICLKINLPNTYNKPWVAGWGMIAFGGPSNSSLLQAELDFLTSANCSARIRKGRFLPLGVNITSQICTVGAGNRSACQGDSGGPLFQYGSRCLKYQVGIISFGNGCEYSIGVNTWILPYLNWIEELVWPDEEN